MSSGSDDAEINRLNNKLTTFYNETINTLKKYKGDDIDKDTAIAEIEIQRNGFNRFMKEATDNEDKLAVVRHFNNLNSSKFKQYYTGGRRNKLIYDTITMKDIRQLCKDNQIKLSRVVNDKRVVYKKKELLTKLKRKKVI